MKNSEKGFSLIELILVMGISLALFGFVSLNLVNSQRINSVNSLRDSLISDMASQQTKAMQGFGPSSGTSYGIHFLPDRYILFRGNVYSAGDTYNFAVQLDQGISFTDITFLNNSLIYSPRSGDISGFIDGNNTVTIRDTEGSKAETASINRYGVVTGVN